MSTEYLDLTQYELTTPVNYTQLYNNDMLKIDTNAKKTANNIVLLSTDAENLKNKSDEMFEDIINLDNAIHSVRNDISIIDGNLDNIATRVTTLSGELDLEKENITSLESSVNLIEQDVANLRELIGNIGDRVDMLQPRTERLFFYSSEKNIGVSDTLHYRFDAVQLPAFIDTNPNSGYKIHYKFVSYTRNGIATLAEFTQTISSNISVSVNNKNTTSFSMYSISGNTYIALYQYIVNALNITIGQNNVLVSDIYLESEAHRITLNSSGITDDKDNSHEAGKIIFSFEIFK